MAQCITFELLLEKAVVPIVYATSHNFIQTYRRFAKANTNGWGKIVIVMGSNAFRVLDNNTVQPISVDPTWPGVMACLDSGIHDKNIIMVFASKDAVTTVSPTLGGLSLISTAMKAYYDGLYADIVRNGIAHAASGISDELRRGTETFQDSPMSTMRAANDVPRLFIVSTSTEMPPALVGSAYNLGCIDVNIGRTADTSGLTETEAEYLHTLLAEVSNPQKRAIAISEARKSIFSGNNVIQDIDYPESFDRIGGYANVKVYVEMLARYIRKETGPVRIKGQLFCGPAGTGKSRIIYAIPQALGLPGYKLDVNAALGQYQGESEHKLRDAIARAKKLAPCCLILDEMEKMLAGTGEGEVAGNEVATKILGIVLTAMAEPNQIIWLASANKVSHLPAPLLRKGRFDRLWYVPLPNETARAQILGIHCKLNGIENTIKEMSRDTIKSITDSMTGFTGAEIAHCVKEAVIKAIADDTTVTATSLIAEARKVFPLSVTRKKELDEIHAWAATNAEPVD